MTVFDAGNTISEFATTSMMADGSSDLKAIFGSTPLIFMIFS
ncbi:hypothetical protein VCHENC02_0975, partial [Vibrio harveyi]